MIRKYHNHKPQTTLWHREESHSTITRDQEDKLSKATSSFFPIKMIALLERSQSNIQQKHRPITDSHNGSNNKQKVNNNRTTALEQTAA